MISIVTLAFNKAEFLEECIDSVVSQRADCELEYVVVDPGSTDGGRDILQRRSGDIDRLLLDPDRGPADGLNKGFAQASGDIFGYLNGDDRFAPGALGWVERWFRDHPDADVLCGAIRIIDRQGIAQARARTADTFDVRRYMAGVCTVGQQGTFFRRRAFEGAGGFNVDNRIAWDGELLVDMAIAGFRFHTERRVLGDFRIYGESITGSSNYRQRLDEYRTRLEQKLAACGYPPMSPLHAGMARLAYRFNPWRHLGYLLAR